MSDTLDALHGLPLFSRLSPEGLEAVAAEVRELDLQAEEAVFSRGDPGDAIYVLLEGAVELRLDVTEEIDQAVFTVRPGSHFGAAECLLGAPRPLTAVAVEPARALRLARESMLAVADRSPATGLQLYRGLAEGVAQGMGIAVDLYRNAVRWSLEVSGATKLGLHHLITESAEVEIRLAGGHVVKGRLLAVEPHDAGHHLVVREAEGRLAFLPYHAVSGITTSGE